MVQSAYPQENDALGNQTLAWMNLNHVKRTATMAVNRVATKKNTAAKLAKGIPSTCLIVTPFIISFTSFQINELDINPIVPRMVIAITAAEVALFSALVLIENISFLVFVGKPEM